MSNRNEKLVKNVLLFAIGNIGSKLLQIILVPLYTRVMTSAEYGTVDIMQAIVSLLMPVNGRMQRNTGCLTPGRFFIIPADGTIIRLRFMYINTDWKVRLVLW